MTNPEMISFTLSPSSYDNSDRTQLTADSEEQPTQKDTQSAGESFSAFLSSTRSIRDHCVRMMRQAEAHEHGHKKRSKFKKFLRGVKSVLKCMGSTCWLICPPLPSTAINKVAFAPPKRTYNFVDNDGKLVKSRKLCVPQNRYKFMLHKKRRTKRAKEPEPSTTDYFFARTKRHMWIACAHLRCNSEEPVCTILFSHQNASDLGCHLYSFPGLQAIADLLSCNVCCYDYAGYGQSSGRACERNVYADIRAVYEELNIRYGVKETELVLWGYSLGTAASIDLASQLQNLAALILTAPFASALRVVLERSEEVREVSYKCDKFASIDKIAKVRAPTLICHGLEDGIVPFSHARMLLQKCRTSVDPCFIEKAGHNDIEYYDEYWIRLYKFLHQELRIQR